MFHNSRIQILSRTQQRLLQVEPWQKTLLVLVIAQTCAEIGFAIVYPFFPLYIEELGSSTGISTAFWGGMVFTAPGLTMMLISPVWGSLADRFGRKLMVQRAMFGGVIVLFLMAFVRSAEELVLLRALQGMITGTVASSNAMMAAQTPRHRMGFAMATLQVGLWGGFALGPVIGGALADIYGFRMPFFITSGLLLFAGLLVHFFTGETFTLEMKQANRRRSIANEWRHVLLIDGVKQIYAVRFVTSLSRALIMPVMPLFIAVLMAGTAFRIAPPEVFADASPLLGTVATVTGLMIGLGSATSTASAVYLGRLGDRIGHHRILLFSAFFSVLVYLPQPFVISIWQLIALQALAGVPLGGIIAAPGALLAHYTDPGEEGIVYGLDNTMVGGGRAIAPLIGAGIGYWFGLRMTFVAMVVIFAVMLLLVLVYLPKTNIQADTESVPE